MQEIHIKVWRNDRQQDWSVDINGERFENVAIDVIGDLVDSALGVDQKPQPGILPARFDLPGGAASGLF